MAELTLFRLDAVREQQPITILICICMTQIVCRKLIMMTDAVIHFQKLNGQPITTDTLI